MFRRLLLGAVLTAGLTASARSAEIDNLLPAETESVMYLNVRQIIDSDLVKKYALGQIKQMLAGNEEAQRMLKDLGLDPLKDIERVTVGIWGKGPEDMQTIAVIRGAFDKDKLIEAAKKEAKNNGDKIAVVKEGEYELVKYTDEKQPKPFFAGVGVSPGADSDRSSCAFDLFRTEVLPTLARLREGEPVRIWSAACGSGQEIYSLAMLVDDERGGLAGNAKIELFASDLSERALEKAQTGLYTQFEIQRDDAQTLFTHGQQRVQRAHEPQRGTARRDRDAAELDRP